LFVKRDNSFAWAVKTDFAPLDPARRWFPLELRLKDG
jgi:hypothetical protein